MPVKMGDVVSVEYIITDKKGVLRDSSEVSNNGPIKVQLGIQQVFRGFEQALIGMEVGEEKQIQLEPEDAFGEMDPILIQKVPKSQFPEGEEIPIGKKIEYFEPNGMSSPAWVRLVEDDYVIIDMNHPLAGVNVNLTVKIVETGLESDPVPNPFTMGLSCSGECGHDHEHEH